MWRFWLDSLPSYFIEHLRSWIYLTKFICEWLIAHILMVTGPNAMYLDGFWTMRNFKETKQIEKSIESIN